MNGFAQSVAIALPQGKPEPMCSWWHEVLANNSGKTESQVFRDRKGMIDFTVRAVQSRGTA